MIDVLLGLALITMACVLILGVAWVATFALIQRRNQPQPQPEDEWERILKAVDGR